jgi:hypothetical protein
MKIRLIMCDTLAHLARASLALSITLISLGGCQTAPPAENAERTEVATSATAPVLRVHAMGINDWQGDIVGTAATDNAFKRVQIGMSMRVVVDLIGDATDQGAYPTGKSWIPMYFGSDAYRHELVYKGLGRLVFTGRSANDMGNGHLIVIIHDAAEGGQL